MVTLLDGVLAVLSQGGVFQSEGGKQPPRGGVDKTLLRSPLPAPFLPLPNTGRRGAI